jgi:methyl-accepting chemotaxis protein
MINYFEGLSIGKKMSFGFSFSIIVLAISVGMTFFYIFKVNQINNKLINLRIPTSQNTLSLINEVNHSLAALRGWIILGKDKFKDEREKAWESLNGNLAKMDQASKNWTNPANVEILSSLKENFVKFKQYQDEIEQVANTQNNTPATKILIKDAAPKVDIMLKSITLLINQELKMPSTKIRKEILGIMADVRGTTARSLANIRAFLLTGDKGFQNRFDKMWAKNIIRVKELKAKKNLLSNSQKIQFNRFFKTREKFKFLPSKMFKIRNSDSWNLANKWLGTKAALIAFKIKGGLSKMSKNQNLLMQKDADLSAEAIDSLFKLEAIIFILGALLSIGVGMFVSKSISAVLKNATTQLTNGMLAISSLTSDIKESSYALSKSSEDQASCMHETSSGIDEINAMVKRNSEDTIKSRDIVDESHKEVLNGVKNIEQMVHALSNINESNEKVTNQVNKSNDKMNEITTIIKAIGEKTEVINDIVFQTKLLSFNASVEAARAGEHGKGFTVVAEEVGNLARMSGEASKEIFEMLESSISSITEVAKKQKEDMDRLTRESKHNIEEGISLTKGSEEFLTALTSNMNQLKSSVEQIATATNEQDRGVEEITNAINEASDKTTINNEISKKAAEVSSKLSKKVDSFSGILEVLSSDKEVTSEKGNNTRTSLKGSARLAA